MKRVKLIVQRVVNHVDTFDVPDDMTDQEIETILGSMLLKESASVTFPSGWATTSVEEVATATPWYPSIRKVYRDSQGVWKIGE